MEAAWDYDRDDWRKDFIDTVKDLAPGAMRFGGLFSRHYKWREGVGPVAKRPAMRNYVWGGKETNRVGTHEFVDFCRRVGAEPFYCVNFLSDGEKRFRTTPEGNRTGDARRPPTGCPTPTIPTMRNASRTARRSRYNLKLWQLGNETSYGNRTFTRGRSHRGHHRVRAGHEAARPFDQADRLGRPRLGGLWAPDLLERAGEHIDMVAMHMMGQSRGGPTRC